MSNSFWFLTTNCAQFINIYANEMEVMPTWYSIMVTQPKKNFHFVRALKLPNPCEFFFSSMFLIYQTTSRLCCESTTTINSPHWNVWCSFQGKNNGVNFFSEISREYKGDSIKVPSIDMPYIPNGQRGFMFIERPNNISSKANLGSILSCKYLGRSFCIDHEIPLWQIDHPLRRIFQQKERLEIERLIYFLISRSAQRAWGLLIWRNTRLAGSAKFFYLALLMPRPPLSLLLVTTSQLRRCIFFLDSFVPHRKFLWILSIVFGF